MDRTTPPNQNNADVVKMETAVATNNNTPLSLFHPFPKLPIELRLCIWEMAVRPTGPWHRGVHFFSVQRDTNNDLFTTIPSFSETSRLPWNPSAYVFDFGMWTACTESRAVVTSQIRKHVEPQDRKHAGVARVRHNEEDITFGLLPDDDLICIQLPDTVNIGRISYDPLEYFDIRWKAWPAYASIGFEYDASWTSDLDKKSIGNMSDEPGPRGAFFTLLEAIISGEIRATLYLIQHGAKLKPDKREWRTFYGNGLKFTTAAYEDVEMEDTGEGLNAWDFRDMVAEDGEICWQGWKDDEYETYGGCLRSCCGLDHAIIEADSHIVVVVCQES